jgi:hypothetical protein
VFRGLGQDAGGRGRWTTARRGMAVMASKRHSGKGRGKGQTGRRGSSPQGGAPAVAHGSRRVARQQRRR